MASGRRPEAAVVFSNRLGGSRNDLQRELSEGRACRLMQDRLFEERIPAGLGNGLKIGDERIQDHLDGGIRGTVEDYLSALFDG
jgi:hypothetical protein